MINGNGAMNNCLEGNYVGTDVDGGFAVSNEIGVLIAGGISGNTVGGMTNAAQTSRNIISGVLPFLSADQSNRAFRPLAIWRMCSIE